MSKAQEMLKETQEAEKAFSILYREVLQSSEHMALPACRPWCGLYRAYTWDQTLC